MLVILCSAQRGQRITKLEAEVTQLKTDLALSQQNAQAAGKHGLSTHLLHMQMLHLRRLSTHVLHMQMLHLCRHKQGF